MIVLIEKVSIDWLCYLTITTSHLVLDHSHPHDVTGGSRRLGLAVRKSARIDLEFVASPELSSWEFSSLGCFLWTFLLETRRSSTCRWYGPVKEDRFWQLKVADDWFWWLHAPGCVGSQHVCFLARASTLEDFKMFLGYEVSAITCWQLFHSIRDLRMSSAHRPGSVSSRQGTRYRNAMRWWRHRSSRFGHWWRRDPDQRNMLAGGLWMSLDRFWQPQNERWYH